MPNIFLTHRVASWMVLGIIAVACVIGLALGLGGGNHGGTEAPPSLQAESTWLSSVGPDIQADQNSPTAMVQLLQNDPPPPYDVQDWDSALAAYQMTVTASQAGDTQASENAANNALNDIQAWQDKTCAQYPTLCNN